MARLEDPRAAKKELVEAGARLSEIGSRLNVSSGEILEALEHLALLTPVGVSDPAKSLTHAEEDALREAGSLQHAMPAWADRASTRTELWLMQVLSDALSVKDAAGLLGVTEGRVRQRLTARTLLGVERSGGWLLPRFQFSETSELPGLAEVLPAFPRDSHPAAVYAFLTRPSADLELEGEPLSPQDWLSSGGASSVVVDLVEAAYALP